jgi:uncharacterized membrane protein
VTSINYTINTKIKRKIYGITGAIITLVFPLFLILTHQDTHIEKAQSLCPFKMLTGFPCAGCGITKSLIFFYEGNIEKSMYYHILGPFLIFFCLFIIIILTTEIITKKEYLNSLFYNKKLAYTLGYSLLIYHTIRLAFFIKNNSIEEILKQSIWN